MSSLQGTTTPIPLNPNTTEPTTGAVSSSTKQQLELHTTSGMEGSDKDKDTKERNVTAFYNVVWPILEKEGGWTLVRCFNYCSFIVCVKRLEPIDED